MSDYYQFRDETGAPIDYYQLVNEDIFNEVNDILQKYKEIIGDKENE